MKLFTVPNNTENLEWIEENLDERDWENTNIDFTIYYYHEQQKEDILNAIPFPTIKTI